MTILWEFMARNLFSFWWLNMLPLNRSNNSLSCFAPLGRVLKQHFALCFLESSFVCRLLDRSSSSCLFFFLAEGVNGPSNYIVLLFFWWGEEVGYKCLCFKCVFGSLVTSKPCENVCHIFFCVHFCSWTLLDNTAAKVLRAYGLLVVSLHPVPIFQDPSWKCWEDSVHSALLWCSGSAPDPHPISASPKEMSWSLG